jgi:cytochrome P450
MRLGGHRGMLRSNAGTGPGVLQSPNRSRQTGPAVRRHIADELRDAGLAVASPDVHADNDRINAALKLLRRHSPVHWVQPEGTVPFWAVTRHADILTVEQEAKKFVTGPRTVLSREIVDISLRQLSGRDQLFRPLTHMDDPDHRAYRAITQSWFAPKHLCDRTAQFARLARQTVDRVHRRGTTCDFAKMIAPYPLQVIMSILGVPETDLPLMLRLTRGLLNAEDPDSRKSEPPLNAVRIAMTGLRKYFDKLSTEVRANPRDDLATVIANAVLGGKAIPDFERLSYFMVIATGGHHTTTFALVGGLHALAAHPDQFAHLKRKPELLDDAIEEMLRWTSPVRHFVRTATKDCTVGGTRIRAGDSLALFFNSGNRDETVFDRPEVFRIDRKPNPQIAFGHGIHFCLGNYLARMEMRAIFGELLGRLDHIELAGPPQWARSTFIGGIKSLPIRYKLRAAPN